MSKITPQYLAGLIDADGHVGWRSGKIDRRVNALFGCRHQTHYTIRNVDGKELSTLLSAEELTRRLEAASEHMVDFGWELRIKITTTQGGRCGALTPNDR